uniref:Tripartite motif-containing protein 2 n=1 Tax=Cacopsylla melanoneura TaxID=428564 RepID=A0A8D9AT27_9HEMI
MTLSMSSNLSTNSTLVETVSINYEDFNESFLTCGTCLCMYDGGEHTPKLLQCSHTVCLHCLTRIAASQTRDTGTLRCPICREQITIPRGGVAALPPSFLVNQLLDLMSRQRRHIIPKCSTHSSQELLFCETCDTVFCLQCTGGSHNSSSGSGDSEHTIIPFSIAIKRMSEILLYKANECVSKLKAAQDTVSDELDRLENAKQSCLNSLEKTFIQISDIMTRTHEELARNVTEATATKRKVLEEQIALIQAETEKVQAESADLQYQVEVRSITARISNLAQKLDAVSALADPRENAFLSCDVSSDVIRQVETSLASLARVRTTTTFPSLSTLSMKEECIVNLESTATVTTVDYHGNGRTTGGDPMTIELTKEGEPHVKLDTPRVVDMNDGVYKIKFRPTSCGRYCLKVSVLERPIRDSPLHFNVTEHNNPVDSVGGRGGGREEFQQPVAVAVDSENNLVYVLDTGNSRIKVLDTDLRFLRHLENPALLGKSCTGIATIQIDESEAEVKNKTGLIVVNWRSKDVTKMTSEGDTVYCFTHDEFQEPTDVAVDPTYGHILVADNGPACVFVFDTKGKLLFQVGKKGSTPGCFSLMSSITVGAAGEIIIADSRIQVFNGKGDFLLEFPQEAKGKGKYGGVSVDEQGLIVASRSEGSRHYVQVFRLADGALVNTIDSHSARLKRPTGLSTGSDSHCYVIDLGNHAVSKYRYW